MNCVDCKWKRETFLGTMCFNPEANRGEVTVHGRVVDGQYCLIVRLAWNECGPDGKLFAPIKAPEPNIPDFLKPDGVKIPWRIRVAVYLKRLLS